MGSRWYDPYLNRFLSPDDIIPDQYNPQAWDRYAYVFNNSINHNDPTGHIACLRDEDNFTLKYCNPTNEALLRRTGGYNITFQGKWSEDDHLAALTGALKVGIALGGVIRADDTLTFNA